MVLPRGTPGSRDLGKHREFVRDAVGLVAPPGSQEEEQEEEGASCACSGREGPRAGWDWPRGSRGGEGQRLEPSRAVPLPLGSAEERLCQIPGWNWGCLNTTTVQGAVSGLGAADSPEKAVGAGWQDQPERESDKRLS